MGVSCETIIQNGKQLSKNIEIFRGQLIQTMLTRGLSPVMEAEAVRGPMLGWPAASSTPIQRDAPAQLWHPQPVQFRIGDQLIPNMQNVSLNDARINNDNSSLSVFSPLGARNQVVQQWNTQWDQTISSDPGVTMTEASGSNPRPLPRVQRVLNLAQMEQNQIEPTSESGSLVVSGRAARSPNDGRQNQSFI